MKRAILLLVTALAVTSLKISSAFGQEAPAIIWEVPTPNGLANSIVGVGWASGAPGQVAMGSTDRWLRTRQSDNGALIYSILGPQHSRGGDQTIYSNDGSLLAVHNVNKGFDYRVYRAADGVFLGTLLVTIDANDLLQFAPDAQLKSSIPKRSIVKRFHVEEFTVVRTVGSGYDLTTTTFNFSPDGAYQSVASEGTIKILARGSGAVVSTFPGGASGFTPLTFTPDSTAVAFWERDSNATTLRRAIDGALIRQFPDAVPEEGIGDIRFSPDGTRMVTTGYLAIEGSNGWEQTGIIRFWRVSDGALRHQFDQHTGIAVTSPIAFSPDASQFVYGTYEGTVVAAQTPTP